MKVTHLLLFILSLAITSCADKKSDKNIDEESLDSSEDALIETVEFSKLNGNPEVYFFANGTEPFWNITISEKGLKLKTLEDSILTPHTSPIFAQDSNVKRYNLSTERAEMTVQISHVECINAMSGEAFPYSVSIRYKLGTDEEFKELEGCGKYITDPRLNGAWSLSKLNGASVSANDFNREVPNLKINSEGNFFSGFAGCNRTKGNLFFERNLLRFTQVVSTRMLCRPNNKEDEFLKALQSSTTYKFDNDRLILSNPDGELLVFTNKD